MSRRASKRRVVPRVPVNGKHLPNLTQLEAELARELKLALEWLDGIVGQANEGLLNERPLSALAPWARKVMGAMPNNWEGRIAMRRAIDKAEGNHG